jgi:N-ethylmaleimide reductase
MTDLSALFKPFQLGDLTLGNRIAMSPMVRARADQGSHCPDDLLAEYYAQRVSAGLIVCEATAVSSQAANYYRSCGIYSGEQITAWHRITDRIHRSGGRAFLQLLHAGRATHLDNLPDGVQPVAPSAIRANCKTYTSRGFEWVSAPRALGDDEILDIVASFRAAARNARQAGFDGVEIHAANGYLLDQFMKDGSNHRVDDYGGSIDNRLRLTLQVLDAAVAEWGPARVGIRISCGPAQDASDSDPQALFTRLVDEIERRDVAYIHLIEGTAGLDSDSAPVDYHALRRRFRGVWMVNNGYTAQSAAEAVGSGYADLVSFGRLFVANPDLVARLRLGAPLNALNKETLFGGGAVGLTDYPFMGLDSSRPD